MDFFDDRVLAELKDGEPKASQRFWAKWGLATTLCSSIMSV
jgi:hypothetical protein